MSFVLSCIIGGITGTAHSSALPQHVKASFYADAFEGRRMANGSIFHQQRITAASRSFRLGTIVKVISIATGKSIIVTVTDRGPWCRRFSLDLSKRAFTELGLNPRAGWGMVSIERFSE